MPRPNQPRTNGAEDRVRENVRRLLDEQDRSAAWLGRKMAEAGCSVGNTAVWKSLYQGRRIVVDEAIAMAAALGVSVTDLLSEPA